MLCGRSAGEYRAYLPRARWIRDANDSYFAAMTYPQGLPSSSQPTDIHDATWGILSAVYGGAVHPSAEGHAAMADAALPAVASVLQLNAEADVTRSRSDPRERRRNQTLQRFAPAPLRPSGQTGGLFNARALPERWSSSEQRGRLHRTGRRLHRRGLRRQVFRHDAGIELGHRRIRQPEPGLILAEQGDTQIAAHE